MVSFDLRDTSSRGGKRFRKLPREVSSPGAVTDDSIASDSPSKSDLIDGLFSLVSFFFKSAIDENTLKSVATGNNRRTGKAIKQDC